MSILRQSQDLELVERMAEAGWNANPGRPAALTWACRESALMRKEAYELRQMMQAALRVVHAADQWDNRQCADCGYPVGDKPVFLGGVWFCATCNPAISLLGGDIES